MDTNMDMNMDMNIIVSGHIVCEGIELAGYGDYLKPIGLGYVGV